MFAKDIKELPRGKLRAIKLVRFCNLHHTFIVICLPCEMRSLFLWGVICEICGLKAEKLND